MRAFTLHQRFRYEYTLPVHHLEHRLIVVPLARHGDQRRVAHGLGVRGPRVSVSSRNDRFGNRVIEVRSPAVPRFVEFEAWTVVERDASAGPHRVPLTVLDDPRLTRASKLTRPDGALAETAAELRRETGDPLELAERANQWVHRALTYSHDVTTVRTTASEAVALGAGVCQDYSHVMLAILRLCGVAARYVSGHLVGEGGTHAWVEAVAPDRHEPGSAVVVPFDPTHGRRAGPDHVTVAVGADYTDVAPTSGTFRAPCAGRLSCRKRLSVGSGRAAVPMPAPVLEEAAG